MPSHSKRSMQRFKVPQTFTLFVLVWMMEWFPEFARKYLNFNGKCFTHCDRPTSMQVVSQDASRFVGAYLCPDGFVSQVVYFSLSPDMKWFEDMIANQVGNGCFTSKDVRVGSRHGWELGGDAQEILESKLGAYPKVTEVYWTRYPRTDADKQVAISLCVGEGSQQGCLKLFAHDRNVVRGLCPTCQSKW